MHHTNRVRPFIIADGRQGWPMLAFVS